MKIVYTVLLAAIGLACVLACDFLLQKIPTETRIGKFTSQNSVRMAISYLLGILIFLVGIRVFYVML